MRLGELCRARSSSFHSNTRNRAVQHRAETGPLTKQHGVGGAEPLAGRGAGGNGNARARRAQTRAKAAPLRGHGAAAMQGPDRDVGVSKAAAAARQKTAATRKKEKIIVAKVLGIVKWYNVKQNYGFITRCDNKEDIFVHCTAIMKNNPKKYIPSLGDKEVVEFKIIQGRKGLQAANVTGSGGVSVKGSIYAANRSHPRQYPHYKQPMQSPFPNPTFPFYPISCYPFFHPWFPSQNHAFTNFPTGTNGRNPLLPQFPHKACSEKINISETSIKNPSIYISFHGPRCLIHHVAVIPAVTNGGNAGRTIPNP
uniref:Uncharacterized protein n=1 Tax=Corvus moneduloides TaxID=1196302 RepID=A0A8C3E024_CORMO